MADTDNPDLNAPARTDAALEPDRVAGWLTAHPEFLVDHPELAERLTLPDGEGTVSLTEFRSRRLVDENARLSRQLNELTHHAGRNEDLTRRLHALTLALAEAPDPGRLVAVLADRLTEDFGADALQLRLSEEIAGDRAGISVATWTGDRPDWVQALLESGRPDCGRLTQAKRSWLFGDAAERIGSAALVPFGGDGLLAIGAADDDRFQPDMGTLFLELLGETLAHRLRALTADGEQRRRA
jgi:uncharacterized protein YigA (DUF484 family)